MNRLVKYGSLTMLVLASIVLSFFIVSNQELRAQGTISNLMWTANDAPAAVDALLRARDFPRSLDFVLIPGMISHSMGGGEMTHPSPYGVMSHGHGHNQPLMLGEVGHGTREARDFMLDVRLEDLKAKARGTETRPGKIVFNSAFPALRAIGMQDTRRAAGGVLYRPGGNAMIDPSPGNDPKQGRWQLTPDPSGLKKPGPMAYFSQVFGETDPPTPGITFVKNGADFRDFLGKIAEGKAGRKASASKSLRGAINNMTPADFMLRVDFRDGMPAEFHIHQVLE